MQVFSSMLLSIIIYCALGLIACSDPPPLPNSGAGGASPAAGFSAESYFNSGCQVCHTGSQPLYDLSDGVYDGEYIEEALGFTDNHNSYSTSWPQGEDAEKLAQYINENIAAD